VWPFLVVHVTELVEALLLPLHRPFRRASGLGLESAAHSLVRAALLRVSRHDAFDPATPSPPTCTGRDLTNPDMRHLHVTYRRPDPRDSRRRVWVPAAERATLRAPQRDTEKLSRGVS
jgi:hypothetical protein